MKALLIALALTATPAFGAEFCKVIGAWEYPTWGGEVSTYTVNQIGCSGENLSLPITRETKFENVSWSGGAAKLAKLMEDNGWQVVSMDGPSHVNSYRNYFLFKSK